VTESTSTNKTALWLIAALLVIVIAVLLRDDIALWWECSMTGNGRGQAFDAAAALTRARVCG